MTASALTSHMTSYFSSYLAGRGGGRAAGRRVSATLAAARVAHGVALLSVPNWWARTVLGVGMDAVVRTALKVLGLREIGQATAVAVLSRQGPEAPLLVWGARVDALHAASMVAVAAVLKRYRRAALVDVAIASGFAVAGVVAARREIATRRGVAAAQHMSGGEQG